MTLIGLTILALLCASIAGLIYVCGKKGLLYILSLAIVTVILIALIVPLINQGYDPVLITFLAAIPIVCLMIYCNEGFGALSHLSVIATLAIFFIISIIIFFSVDFAHFSGIVSDSASIVGGQMGIDLPKILTSGIMLGTLGALIEMVTTQISTVMELMEGNSAADKKEIYKKSHRVGVVHLGSVISTLFLIYAGASLPLLIIAISSHTSFGSIILYEPLSSEIVRMLTGTLGLIIAMPASTLFSIWWLKRK